MTSRTAPDPAALDSDALDAADPLAAHRAAFLPSRAESSTGFNRVDRARKRAAACSGFRR